MDDGVTVWTNWAKIIHGINLIAFLYFRKWYDVMHMDQRLRDSPVDIF